MATKHFLGGRIILGTEFVGYKFKFFEPGTSTLKTTYKDSALTAGNENTSTVTLDANGAAQIWFDGNADVVFYTTADAVVYSDDDINVTSSTSSTGSGNLSINASFEDDTDADGIPDNWTRTLYSAGTFTLDTTDQFNGQKSIKFVSTGTGGGYVTSTDTFAVSPSVGYSLGFAIKSTADVRNVVEVLWYQDDGSASAVSASTTAYDNSTTNPTSWTEQWAEVLSPSDAAFAAIRLTGCHSSDATSGTARFDAVVFTDLAHKRAVNTFRGSTPIKFEGATENDYEISLSIEEPATSDKTITVPNRTGTLQLNTTPGQIVQRVEATPYTTYTAVTTPYMVFDDTVPQNTEGTEWVTVSITPTSATNRLVIRSDIPYFTVVTANTAVAMALFQDSTANALRVSAVNVTQNESGSLSLHHEMAAGTTSATTFKIRAASASGGMNINGGTAARLFGGISAVTLSVTEIAV